MTFTHAYNMGSWTGAVCVASRTMLNTGRFLWRAQGLQKRLAKEREAGRFWPDAMRKAGYETYFTGKWHVKADTGKAFDHAVHVRGGMPKQTPQGYNRPHEGKPDPWKPWDRKFGGFWEGGTHWSEVLGDDACGFIRQAAKREKPFFMYLAFNAPHDPRQSPKSYVDRYPLDRVRLPENFLPQYPYKDAMGCGKGLRDEKLAPFPRTPYAVKVNRQEYYAIITHMDAQIGRILDALEASGRMRETYVFFTADHGLAVGHHGLMGKQNLYDHSMRVPFIAVGPGVAKGTRCATPIYLQDVMATALDLAGGGVPDWVQFKSLRPFLGGGKVPHHGAIYGAYLGLQRAVSKDGWKLILYPKISRARLYHVEKDPHEMKDLASDPASKPVLKRLFTELLRLQKETGDTMDLKKAFSSLAR
jgi:choline-sulfatase